MSTDEDARIVARLRYPMRADGIDTVMTGIARMYADPDLIVVTGGPLWVDGWMTIAHPGSDGGPDRGR